MVRSMGQALGVFDDVLSRAGRGAWRDVLLAAPPIALAALIAGRLGTLPRSWTAPAAVMTVAGVAVASYWAVLAAFG